MNRKLIVAGAFGLILLFAAYLQYRDEGGTDSGGRSRDDAAGGGSRVPGPLAFVRSSPQDVMYPGDAILPKSADIYTIEADEEAPRNLTRSAALEFGPSWLPTGESIAFMRGRASSDSSPKYAIYSIDPSGEHLKSLVPCSVNCERLGDPTWSPDGSSIAFTRYPAVLVAPTTGEPPEELWRPSGRWTGIQALSWSPDGDDIALTALDSGTGQQHVLVLDVETGRARAITGPGFGWPSWAPDSERLVVVEGRYGKGILYTVGVDGDSLAPLIKGCRSATCRDRTPAWAPSGEWIAFARKDDIYMVRSDGSDLVQVTQGEHRDCCPSWGPPTTADL